MPPQAASAARPASANSGMGGFAGMAPSQPAPPSFPPPPVSEADLAAQLARINAEAMAEAPPEAPPEKRGGIFSRLTRKREPVPPLPPPPAPGMGDAFAARPGLAADASMDEGPASGAGMAPGLDAAMGDAAMGDAAMGDAGMGFDAALAEQALPGEKPPRRKGGSVVAIGWLALALVRCGRHRRARVRALGGHVGAARSGAPLFALRHAGRRPRAYA